MIFYSNIFDINLTKKTVFVLMTGLWLLIFSSTINAQPAGYGCDDLDWSNYGVNSNNDASSIQYDNFVNMFHGAIIRNPDGYFYTWGERMRPSNSPTNSSNDITTPEKIDNTFSSTLTGQYLMATGGSNLNNANYQAFILTTDGLFVWGKSNIVISSSLTSTQSVSKVSGGSNMTAKGLPSGVEPRDVKMLWATFNTLALLTCDGKAYVLSRNAYMRGAGSSATSSTTWYRVKTSASGNPDLENVIALRGASRAMMALTSDNKVYTWGPQVYLGDGSALKTNNSDNYYATQMTLPTTESGSIKMIQATTKGTNSTETDITISISTSTTYYILYANGHLWALGDGTGRQLGNWSTSNSNTWVQPKYPDTGNPSQAGLPMNDIVWISANEHDGTNSEIAAINTGKKMWNWGGDARSMLGRGDLSAMADADINGHPKNPGQPAFNDDPNNPERANRGEDFDGAVDNVLAISTGGHTIMLIKECSTRLGYMGHAVGGSAATGYSTDKQFPFTTFTSYIQVFGVETDVKIKLNIGIITDGNGDICTHQKVTVLGIPPGGILSLTQNPNNFATLIGNEITFDESKMSGSTEDISIHYEVEDVCGPVSIDTTFTITKLCQLYQVNGNVWIDVNKDAEYDSYEQGTNLSSGSYTGLYANLVDENDNVVQSVKVNADGSYNLVTVDGSQIYSIVITRNEIGIGIPIPSGQLNLPSGWLYTGNNDGTPHINPSEPYKISGIDFSFSNEFNDIDFGLTGTSSISGNVFHDPDGLSDGSITESNGNNNLGKDLTGVSVLLIYNNVVIATTTTNNGEYSFDELPDGPYTIILTSDIGISVGDNAPVSSSLPNGWVSTGEYHGVGTGDDTLVDGQLSLTLTGNETNLNFGLEQLPTAIGGVGVSQINPGGTNTVVVPQSLLGGTDPDGTVDNIHYISFPSNVTSIIIDNITYTSINWPSGGVTVPIGTIVEIDPISGSVTSEIPFRVIDNAGFESENTSSAEMPFIEGSPSIEIVKTGTYQDSDGVTGVSAGDEIHYTFTVTNTGNVTLTNVVVTDPKVTVAGGPISSMAPGAVDNSTFTATYVITQADINAGNVENTAEVSGKDPDNSDVTDVDTEDTPLGQTPSIDLVKSGTYVDADNDGVVSAGDEIHYTFTVTNTGNVTLTNVVVTDPKVT
ncbi:MAG: DUF11 domain-containing protein, partial [Saprospiraceae bacterium]|nr:DUF11 domain-containing protein [Saprospiraceae bacterium]